MALDLDAVANGLAAAVKAAQVTLAGVSVIATPFQPASITPPHFVVGTFVLNPDRTFGGMDEVTFTCRLYVARGDEPDNQQAARQAASSRTTQSMKAALEAARGAPGQLALGGAADDLNVQRISGPHLYDIAGAMFYGIEYQVLVVG